MKDERKGNPYELFMSIKLKLGKALDNNNDMLKGFSHHNLLPIFSLFSTFYPSYWAIIYLFIYSYQTTPTWIPFEASRNFQGTEARKLFVTNIIQFGHGNNLEISLGMFTASLTSGCAGETRDYFLMLIIFNLFSHFLFIEHLSISSRGESNYVMCHHICDEINEAVSAQSNGREIGLSKQKSFRVYFCSFLAWISKHLRRICLRFLWKK